MLCSGFETSPTISSDSHGADKIPQAEPFKQRQQYWLFWGWASRGGVGVNWLRLSLYSANHCDSFQWIKKSLIKWRRGCRKAKGRSSRCPTFVQCSPEPPPTLASRVVTTEHDRKTKIRALQQMSEDFELPFVVPQQYRLNENTKLPKKAHSPPPEVLILFWEEMFQLGLWLKVRIGAYLESTLGFHHILYSGCLRES